MERKINSQNNQAGLRNISLGLVKNHLHLRSIACQNITNPVAMAKRPGDLVEEDNLYIAVCYLFKVLLFYLCTFRMEIKREKNCRLCLKVVKNEYVELDEILKEIFNILLLKLNLNTNGDSVICQDCIEVAKKCLNLKSTCLDIERIILLFSIDTENTKHDINVIFDEKTPVEGGTDEALGICRFCVARLERNNFAPLDILRNETNMYEMLPEMDFNIIENPLICTTCRENLEDYFKFVVNCLDIERKIKVYCKEEGNGSVVQVHLGNVPMFSFKDVLECTIKEESNIFENTECINQQTCSQLIKHKELDIKEEIILKENYNINPSKVMLGKDDDRIKEMNIIQYRVLKNQTNVHKKATKRKKTNDVISNKMYKCSSCAYKSRYKGTLNRHTLIHKDVSEVPIYKCLSCCYETKHKMYLKSHSFVHKDVAQLQMHNCSLCAYAAKQKDSLKRHMVVHKDVSEIKMFKCSFCAYKTIWRNSLRNHLLVHKDVSEIKMHKCSFCVYEAKQKRYLKSHMLTHKDDSERKMLKCSLCAYETKWKKCFQIHSLVHKDVSEITMYKCAVCSYETNQKMYLRSHLSVHRDGAKLKMHNCSLCSYQTKLKSSLKRHMEIHKDVSEIKMHKCSYCAYTCKQKRSLKNHLLKHNVSEIEKHKCSLCAYLAEHNDELKGHMLVHGDMN